MTGSKNTNDNDCELIEACSKRDISRVLELLDEDLVKVNAKKKIRNGSTTAMIEAVRSGSSEIVELLIEHGSKLDIRDDGNFTPFHWACYRNDLDICYLLIQNGADLDAKHSDGTTAFHLAGTRGLLGLTKLLADHGANLNVQDQDGLTALHTMCLTSLNDRVHLRHLIFANKITNSWNTYHDLVCCYSTPSNFLQ